MPAEPGPGAPPLRGLGPHEGLRPGLTWPAAADRSGALGPTPGQARGPRFRKSSYGRYVPQDVASIGNQRIVEAAATFRAGVVTGWAALEWQGARWVDERAERPVPLVLQANEGQSAHPELVAVSQEFLHPTEVIRVDGLRLTTPVRSAAFEMRYAPSPLRAAQIFAMAAYDDVVSIDEITAYCAHALPRCTGVGQVRDVLSRLTENAWSPTEVTMGWSWQHAFSSARVRHNVPVFDLAGRHIATVDVLDVDAGVGGEYHGALHFAGRQPALDVVREEKLRAAGLEIVLMTAVDLPDPGAFLNRLERAYEMAPRRDRAWTVEQPAWWTDTSTVTARRSLSADQRGRALRYRDAA